MSRRNGHDANRGNRDNGYLNDAQYIGSGVTRDVSSCRVRGGCVAGYTQGSYLVYKKFKPAYANRGYVVSPEDVSMQQYCKFLAEEFNVITHVLKSGSKCPVIVRDAAFKRFAKTGPVLLEREVEGEWTRFTSNSGWTRNCDPIVDFFSHWTYKYTGRRLIVTDLQGHRGEPGGPKYLNYPYYYMLTDPCINSRDREYGITDLGNDGIDMFFRNHKCNYLCRAYGLHGCRPSLKQRALLPMRQSTSYSLDNLHSNYRSARFEPQLEVFFDDDSSTDSDY